MPLEARQELSHYRLVEQIGQGGMGVVWLADDTRLGRQVALKMLPEELAADPDRLARFDREARVLASLNHPNIGAIHGLEEDKDIRFLVLELVPGDTLAERLSSGPMKLEECLGVARQIAEALQAAHGAGILHRDLKPANIKITPDGKVKVLDFGLAKELTSPAASSDLSLSPTITAASTQAGVIMGTAAYMSPEQARGQDVDQRTDVWAFGCLLFEMLTGRLAFGGPTVSDSLAAILEREPPVSELPQGTPTSVRRLVRRCLSKELDRRLCAIGDARIEIQEALEGTLDPEGTPGPETGTHRPFRVREILLGLAALIGLTLAAGLWILQPGQTRGPTTSRWVIPLAPGLQVAIGGRSNPLAVSPQGTRIVYAADLRGNPQLYLRDLDSLETRILPGTEGARNPFFSPDGEWVGFFSGSRLMKVSLQGGLPQTLCETPLDDLGGSWSAAGFIVFAQYGSGLSQVSAEGGSPQAVTTLDYGLGEVQHRWPQILPDGEHVLFTVASDKGSRVSVVSLASGERRSVPGLVDVSRAWYAPGGRLIYGQAGGLMAVGMNLDAVEAEGNSISVLEGVASVPDLGNAYFAISESGTMVYVPGGASGETELVWVDRQGQEISAVQEKASYMHVRLSPDGGVATASVGSEVGPRRIMMYDLDRGTRSVLAKAGSNLTWNPDGREVFYSSNRSGSWNIYRSSVDGSDAGTLILDKEREQWVGTVSPDGTVLSFYEVNPQGGRDIWMLPLDGGEPEPFLATPFNERSPRFSPDGKWLAYVSNESGRDEVYVVPYPGRQGKRTISTEGGREPVWSHDGRELFYRQGDRMLVVAIDHGPPFSAARPQVVFEGRYEVGVAGNPDWDISPDSQRFLMIQRGDASAPTRLHVILDWLDSLEGLSPTGG